MGLSHFYSIFLKAHWGAFRGLRTVGHVPWSAYYAAVPAAPGGLNVAWVTGKTHTSERLILYGTYGHTAIFTGTGAILSNAVRGVSRVICG